jgi:hypothetical protein
MKVHVVLTVRQVECLSSLLEDAAYHGIREWNNATLRVFASIAKSMKKELDRSLKGCTHPRSESCVKD